MNRKKKPKADTSRKLLIERMQPEEATRVLQRLLAAHPELEMEAEGVAKSLLRAADFEVIADDICDAIQSLGYEQLQGRAGRQAWGYVEPDQAAADILNETIAPFLDDLKRRVDLGLQEEALEQCKGLVLGCYRLEKDGGGDLVQYAPEFPGETAACALEIWRDGATRPGKRTIFSNEFIEQFVPEWDTMVVRVCSKTR